MQSLLGSLRQLLLCCGTTGVPLSNLRRGIQVSYEKMLAKNLDTTQAQDLTAVVDTETYYQSLTQDGTTTGESHISCLTMAGCPYALNTVQAA